MEDNMNFFGIKFGNSFGDWLWFDDFNFLCTNRKYKAQKVLKSMQFFLLT